MTTTCWRRFSTTLLTVLSIAIPAAGQTSDPKAIQRRVETGAIVAIVKIDGDEAHGRVEAIDENALEIQPIIPGTAANEYRTAGTRARIPIEQIAGLNRVDAFGRNPEFVYQRHDTFGTLPQRLQTGEFVKVTEKSGVKIFGSVLDVSTSALVITGQTTNPRDGSGRPRHEWSGPRTLGPSLVEKIERPAHLWDGALKGALVAMGIVAVTAASLCRGDCYGPAVGMTLAMGAGIGAGAGIGIDALFPPKQIYRAPK